ncbi:MAG: dipeptidyl-peptidase 3 family protein [Verrucomicrobiales bacterium]
MKTTLLALFAAAATCYAADPIPSTTPGSLEADSEFQVVADKFADVQILRYQAPEFDQLTLQQKKLAYFLTEAGLAGRDIFYDQKYKHNLLVRKTLEGIIKSYKGDRKAPEFEKFLVYAKQVFFSNGIHHHYSGHKMLPGFSQDYLKQLIKQSSAESLPAQGKSPEQLAEQLTPILFDPKLDAKLVDLSADTDNVKASAVNFYEGVTEEQVEKYYSELAKKPENARLSLGLNSKVISENGKVTEKVWKLNGMYHPAIEKIIYWLKQAVTVAENDLQKEHLQELIAYYQTGDLERFNQHCVKWVQETEGRIDVVNGFIEVYQDPMQKKGSFESVVSMKDMEATKRIAAISREAQWFEDHSPIRKEHKKKDVVGISAKVITVLGETGDSAPATPVGINLPNADWIREKHGSKSVMLGNIMAAYNFVRAKSPATEEFAPTPEIAARIKKYGALASNLHVDMHEVIGHASGKLNPGVATPDKTLKNYAGTLEEARADLVALYFAMDQKLVDIGVMPSVDVGKAEYDSYIMAGLMTQLYRLKPGENLEEAHMRNRQIVSAWAYEKGKSEKVIERIDRNGKTYFQVNDYQKLRKLFGDLLAEIQRIKSEGDYEAATRLVETYGVKVDQKLLAEVHKRYAPLEIAPYQGFIQPRLVPVLKNNEITNVKIEYPNDFLKQMLEYGEKYGLLPVYN